MNFTLQTPIKNLGVVGRTTAAALTRLNLHLVQDLIWHLPVRHDDLSLIKPIAQLNPGEVVTVHGRVEIIANRRSWKKRMIVTEAVIADSSGKIKATWFHQPYLPKIIPPGTKISLSGRITGNLLNFSLVSPTYEKLREEKTTTHTSRLVPIYPATEGVTQKQLRFLIKEALTLVTKLPETISSDLRQAYKLVTLSQALGQYHFPTSTKTWSTARTRLAFEELLLLMLRSKRAQFKLQHDQAPIITADIAAIKEMIKELPFHLTEDQRLTAWQIIKDLNRTQPMQRLLQGDVGSGKTVVAAIACLTAAKAGWQAALLAPTSILAEQHWQTIQKIFKSQKLSLALLTANRQEYLNDSYSILTKAQLYKKINNHEINIVVGTHALLQEKVIFPKLGLLIIDEQHRFGVAQRAALRHDLPTTPHLLSMTATPIPRSLALILSGQLDISTIHTKPAGRPPITTIILPPHRRDELYQYIRSQVAAGRQAFIICPHIEESDTLGIKAATTEYERLTTEVLSDLKLGLLHGQLKPVQKTKVMQDFATGKIQVLVTTTVIEVGVDVPNATIMAIEGAEHFGLAQLHQLRGRVGRGEHNSYCILLSETGSGQALKRLQLLAKLDDGFALAEADLNLRGPGQIFGTQQSGIINQFKVASLTDHQLIKLASAAATQILTDDPQLLKHSALKQALDTMETVTHLE